MLTEFSKKQETIKCNYRAENFCGFIKKCETAQNAHDMKRNIIWKEKLKYI